MVRRHGAQPIWQLAQLVSPYVIVLTVSDDVELEGVVVWYRTTLWERGIDMAYYAARDGAEASPLCHHN